MGTKEKKSETGGKIGTAHLSRVSWSRDCRGPSEGDYPELDLLASGKYILALALIAVLILVYIIPVGAGDQIKISKGPRSITETGPVFGGKNVRIFNDAKTVKMSPSSYHIAHIFDGHSNRLDFALAHGIWTQHGQASGGRGKIWLRLGLWRQAWKNTYPILHGHLQRGGIAGISMLRHRTYLPSNNHRLLEVTAFNSYPGSFGNFMIRYRSLPLKDGGNSQDACKYRNPMIRAFIPWWVGAIGLLSAIFMAHWELCLFDYRRRLLGVFVIIVAAILAHSSLWLFATGECLVCGVFC